jgi:hypothetical protein
MPSLTCKLRSVSYLNSLLMLLHPLCRQEWYRQGLQSPPVVLTVRRAGPLRLFLLLLDRCVISRSLINQSFLVTY